MHPLDDIANRARVLARLAPDNAERLCKATESLRICQEDDDRVNLRQFVESSRHELRCWERGCREAWELMNQLAALVYCHLPELDLELVRINPQWRYDDPATDWPAIGAELRRIEDAALRRLMAPAAAAPLTDRQHEALEYIRKNQPVTGKQIASEMGTDESTVTRHYIPALKAYGVKNRRGAGYYLST